MLGPEHQYALNKLFRKGILVERQGKLEIVSPLFASFLVGQVGRADENQQATIRRIGILDETHQHLFYELFKSHYYIEWEYLQEPRADDPTVYLVNGEDRKGNKYRPRVVKVGTTQEITEEIEKTRRAKDLLGSVVPTILAEKQYKGYKAMMSEIATTDNRNFRDERFADFYSARAPEDIEPLLEAIFIQSLCPLYKQQVITEKKYYRYYFLPRSDQGEFRTIESICKESNFWEPNREELRIPGIPKALRNPGISLVPGGDGNSSDFYTLFAKSRRIGLSMAHGDLNPRNLLIDGVGHFHIIDFSEMKDLERGTRFLDLTRLEVEIKFKLARSAESSLIGFVGVENLLVGSTSISDFERLKQLPLDPEARKMLVAVTTLRELARRIVSEKEPEVLTDYEYKLGLLAQTLRIALFSDYLAKVQQEFAVISAALLSDWLLANDPSC